MSYTADILTGLAAYLAAGTYGDGYDAGGYEGTGAVGTFRLSGTYGDDDIVPIFLGDMPGSPDKLIVLTAYPVDDAPSLSDSTTGLQVRTRGSAGSPRSVDDLDDAVFDRLHGARGITAGAVRIVQVIRRSGAPMGVDGNRRHGRTNNFYVTAHRPSTHRT